MSVNVDIHPIIVGTAGHVDHGKSSLVRRLTGIDPDRWQEEKERGLTIDLGFAPIELDDGTIIGLIDVPGHERFLKNMVAGATSIDLAILVIAADDGVMPQTREHLDVLELLGVRRGIIALTKVDIVDEETLELAKEEIHELLEGHPLEGAPMYPLSSITGEGVEEFKAALLETARGLEPRSSDGLFRMPVQRVFSLRGFGTVLTGIPLAGSVSTGDQLELVGKGLVSRIRGMHAYRHKVDVARAGHSTAINLPDIPLERAERGDLLAVPGTLEATTKFEVELRGVGEGQPLRHGEEVHLHVGTREVVAKVFLLDQKELPAGQQALGQLLCREPVAALAGDFALLRRLTPARTIAGGRLIGVAGRRLRRFKEQVIDHLHEKERVLTEPVDRVVLSVSDAGERGMTEEQLLGRLGWTSEELAPELVKALESSRIPEPENLFDDYSHRSETLARNEMEIDRHFDWAYDVKLRKDERGDVRLPKPDRYGTPEYNRMTDSQKKVWDAHFGPRNQAFLEDFRRGKLSERDVVRWKYRRYMRNYLATVKAVDESVGRVLKYLDDNGLADNTIVIYASDQGFFLGEHGWYDKRWMFEESFRMPFLIRWPGVVRPDSRPEALIQNIDYAPTFLAAAGLESPPEVQGRSLLPVLTGDTKDWRKSLYYAYYEFGEHAVPQHFGVRTRTHKLIYFPRTDEWNLFDLERDPHEMRSVHDDPAYRQIRSTLTAEYQRLRKYYDAPPIDTQ